MNVENTLHSHQLEERVNGRVHGAQAKLSLTAVHLALAEMSAPRSELTMKIMARMSNTTRLLVSSTGSIAARKRDRTELFYAITTHRKIYDPRLLPASRLLGKLMRGSLQKAW